MQKLRGPFLLILKNTHNQNFVQPDKRVFLVHSQHSEHRLDIHKKFLNIKAQYICNEKQEEITKMADQNIPTQDQQNELLFMQLVMMFQGMALQNLGKVMNPVTNQIERNLEQAKNMIDILGMLDEKTKGNLNDNEEKLMEHVLFELRMNYVDELKKDETPEEQTEEEQVSDNSAEDTASEAQATEEDQAPDNNTEGKKN